MDWQWSESARRYRGPDGRFLSASDSAELRNDFLGKQREAMADLGRQLVNDELTVEEFELAFRERIRLATVTEYTYGRGGRNAMGEDDRDVIAGLVKEQWTFLNAFTVVVTAGTLSAAQIEARAQLYAAAGVQAHAAGESAAWAGSDHEERNVRGGTTAPCSECPALSDRGWVAGGTLPLPGQRECGPNCRCHLERRAKAQADTERLRVVA